MVKLCYLGGREFRVLKKLRDRFVGRLPGERKGLSEAKKSDESENHLFIGHLRDVLNPGIGNAPSRYEPTPAFYTRDSIVRRWGRVGEYFRDLLGMDYHREIYEIMTS